MLDSLVRVSRRVGGATDLLATDMQSVPKHSKRPLKSPSPPNLKEGRQQTSLPFTQPIWRGNNGSLRKVLEKCGQQHQRQNERDFTELKRSDLQPLA